MTAEWARQVIWWQVYPLGFVGAEKESVPRTVHRIPQLISWLDHLISLGCNGLLLGPVFASATHGYDTVDYLRIDPRLGDDADFDALVAACRARGVRLLLDGVFNHAGRDFAPVAQALAEGPGSAAEDWVAGLHDNGGIRPSGRPSTASTSTSWPGRSAGAGRVPGRLVRRRDDPR
jgi:glycosidase